MRAETIETLTNAQLVARAADAMGRSRRATAELLVLLGEIDRRKLYADHACSSLFVYCQRALKMSEGAAANHIHVARLGRRCPQVVNMIADGQLHLSGARALAPHLDEHNAEARLALASRKSKRQIEALVAEWSPQPAPRSELRRLPKDRRGTAAPPATSLFDAPPAPPRSPPSSGRPAPAPAPAPAHEPRPEVTPLGAARFKLTVTLDAEAAALLEELQDLLSHAVPNRDLGTIVMRALRRLRDHERKRRFGVGGIRNPEARRRGKPRKSIDDDARNTPRDMSRRHVPRSVKREVYQRDGEQCTFIDTAGNRCGERGWLELDHMITRFDGGDDSATNLRLRCRAHNALEARRRFGATHMARFDGSHKAPP